MYTLVKVLDSGSSYKSEQARAVVQAKLEDVKITYCDDSNIITHRCQNDVIYKAKHPYVDLGPRRTNPCNKEIHDIFYLEDSDGNIKEVGNSCISLFIQAGYISNVNSPEFKVIHKLLKSKKNRCFLCGKTSKYTAHRKCIKPRQDLCREIQKQQYMKQIAGLFDNVTPIKNLDKKMHKISIKFLERFCEDHAHMIENKEKLLDLKNNCIIDTITRQNRKPTIKQTVMVENILRDYNRIKIMDDENTNYYYKMYGYVF